MHSGRRGCAQAKIAYRWASVKSPDRGVGSDSIPAPQRGSSSRGVASVGNTSFQGRLSPSGYRGGSALGAASVRNLDGVIEKVVFPMPKGLASGHKAPETGASGESS